MSNTVLKGLVESIVKEEVSLKEISMVKHDLHKMIDKLESLREQSMTEWDWGMISETLDHLNAAKDSLDHYADEEDTVVGNKEAYIGFISDRG